LPALQAGIEVRARAALLTRLPGHVCFAKQIISRSNFIAIRNTSSFIELSALKNVNSPEEPSAGFPKKEMEEETASSQAQEAM
jgi:hypothetical protein